MAQPSGRQSPVFEFKRPQAQATRVQAFTNDDFSDFDDYWEFSGIHHSFDTHDVDVIALILKKRLRPNGLKPFRTQRVYFSQNVIIL